MKEQHIETEKLIGAKLMAEMEEKMKSNHTKQSKSESPTKNPKKKGLGWVNKLRDQMGGTKAIDIDNMTKKFKEST